jgi:hypothetical protein
MLSFPVKNHARSKGPLLSINSRYHSRQRFSVSRDDVTRSAHDLPVLFTFDLKRVRFRPCHDGSHPEPAWDRMFFTPKEESLGRFFDHLTAGVDPLRNETITVWLRIDPRFDGIRRDPRYLELLRRMHLIF